MNCKAFCLLAFLVAISSALPCADGPDCNIPETQQLTFENVYPFIDYQLKTQYWQYLRGANLIYRANVDQEDSFLFLSIYRNIVGTFLSVTNWVKGQNKVHVRTLVRLGNGYADDSGAKYGPVQVSPLTMSFNLGDGQFYVDTNEKGQLQINGQVVGEQTTGATVIKTDDTAAAKIAAKCALLDTWVRGQNWHYLRNAQNVHRSGRLTSDRYYCVYNYVNIVGTFFVLASEQISTQEQNLATFVRLGNGYETNSGALYTPVQFEPVVLDFDLLK